jgi:DNA-binding beta-propeller fold protein YncE
MRNAMMGRGEMKKMCGILAMAICACALAARSQERAPLKLTQTIQMPSGISGNFDHFGVDLKGHRLFATAERHHSVEVFDLRTGKPAHTMEGIEIPHAVLYREDLHRIYVTDGGAGELKVFDGRSYKLLQSVKLLVDADSIGYDPATHYLYIVNGGGDAHQTFSFLSIVDTTSGGKVAELKIDGDTLEAMALETSGPKLYVNNRAKNQVEVIDRGKRAVLASWPITGAKVNVAMALDEAHHRLFVACRSGAIVVFDTETGNQLQALAIAKGVDDLVYDPAKKRIYAACDGSVDVYEEIDPDHYRSLGEIPSGPRGRTARLVPQLGRYFVAVPQNGATNAEILVYAVQ